MSDQPDRARAIAQLQNEIATLQQTIDGLATMPTAQQALRPQVAEKQRQLAALLGGGTLPNVTQVQSGGINFGVGTTIGTMGDVFTGDKVMGDKFTGNKTVNHGPTFNAPVSAGRDVNVARNQTINNAAPPPPPAPVGEVASVPMPHLRLWIEDTEGQPLTTLTVGEEAVLRLGVDGDTSVLPPLELQLEADASGVAWPDGASRPLRLKPGSPLRAVRWTVQPEQAGSITMRVLVLAQGTLVQQLALTVVCVEVGGTLSAEQTALVQPQLAIPVGLALNAVAALHRHAAALTLVISQEREGYELLLINQRSTRCRLALTPHGVADLLAYARSELLGIVYMTEGNTNVFQQHNLTMQTTVAEQALARLARLGAYLWNSLFNGPGSGPDSAALGAQLRRLSQSSSLHVTVAAAHLSFPWSLLYDRDLNEPITADGFWGFRHVLATLPTSGRTGVLPVGLSLSAAHKLRSLVGLNLGIDKSSNGTLRHVIEPQRQALVALGTAIAEVTTEPDLRDVLAAGTDAKLVYLYCHILSALPEQRAQRPNVGVSTGVGSTRIVLTESKNGLTLRDIQRAAPLANTPLLRAGPLVVLNACGSAELSPLTYDGLVPYLLDLGARTVVGTECDTPIFFGAAFGPALLQSFIAQRLPIGEALRATRRHFLEQHRNPLGLLYALYGSAELLVSDE